MIMGVMVIVAVRGSLPRFVAVNDGILPVPDAANPIEGLEFVQLMITSVGVPERLLAGIVAPSKTDVSEVTVVIVATGVTVTVNVAVAVAHCPGAEVKVYTPDAWLLTVAGFHTPLMLLVDVMVNWGTMPPAQIVWAVPKSNEGVRIGLTVTVNVAIAIH